MPAIGWIDDREQARITITRTIDQSLSRFEDWQVVDSEPLDELESYPSWIVENDVASIVLDQRLHESALVGYEGSAVARFLRQRFRDLPIYIMTAHISDADLQSQVGEIDDIIDRERFTADPDSFVDRIVRAGSRFYEDNRTHLERLGELATKLADGTSSSGERKELRGLQVALGLPFEADRVSRGDSIQELKRLLDRLEEIEQRIRDSLKGPPS